MISCFRSSENKLYASIIQYYNMANIFVLAFEKAFSHQSLEYAYFISAIWYVKL